MKKWAFRVFWLALVIMVWGVLAVSCVTIQDRMLSPEEKNSVEVIGDVNVKFLSFQPLHIPLNENIKKKAYSRLMAEARKKYTGNVEVVNITADGTYNLLSVIVPFPFWGMLAANFQTVKASGNVVQYTSQDGLNSSIQKKLSGAIANASTEMAGKIPKDSIIAILSVYSSDKNTSEYIIGELEYTFVNTGKFKIVDRRRLDQIRTEQNFQLSGDVSDSSAVSIGNMLGANIVITGEMSGVGSTQRLVLKALDVRTAQIISMSRKEL